MIIKPNRAIVSNGIVYAFALLAAVCLKYHYSRAASDDLLWILAPTARLIEYFSGIRFVYEANSGYINQGYDIVIAPACAGVNFLIIAFGMAVFTGIGRMNTFGQKLLWLSLSAAAAYGLTIGVNALRIFLSIFMYNADIYGGWLTPGRCHRIEGVLIYFFFQCTFYIIMEKIARGRSKKGPTEFPCGDKDPLSGYAIIPLVRSGLIPLVWYLGITVFFPLLNSAYKDNPQRFMEHCCVVVITSLTVFGVILLVRVRWFYRGMHKTLRADYESKNPDRGG